MTSILLIVSVNQTPFINNIYRQRLYQYINVMAHTHITYLLTQMLMATPESTFSEIPYSEVSMEFTLYLDVWDLSSRWWTHRKNYFSVSDQDMCVCVWFQVMWRRLLLRTSWDSRSVQSSPIKPLLSVGNSVAHIRKEKKGNESDVYMQNSMGWKNNLADTSLKVGNIWHLFVRESLEYNKDKKHLRGNHWVLS